MSLVKNYGAKTICPRCERCDWCEKLKSLDIETGKHILSYRCMYPLNGATLDKDCLYCGSNLDEDDEL